MIVSFIKVSVCIVLAWGAWWVALAGVGMLFARACGRRRVRSVEDALGSFWPGLALALVFLMLWHFFLPVNRWAAGCVLGTGWLGFIAGIPRLARGWSGRSVSGALVCLVLVGMTFWVADHCLEAPFHYDSGLYHYSAIRWIEAYPIVPGLGLLHGRLAFNQSYFLYVAMLESGPFGTHAANWAAGLILLPLLAQFAAGLARRPRDAAPRVRWFFRALLAVPVLVQTNSLINLSSPSPDLPLFVLGIVVALELLDLLLLAPAATRGLPWRVARIVLVGTVGITLKFNFIVIGLGAATLATALGVHRLMRSRSNCRILSPSPSQSSSIPHSAFRIPHSAFHLAGRALALALLALLPWAARDLFLSGYVAYPAPYLSVAAPWRIPRVEADQIRGIISSFARDPLKQQPWPVQGWKWLGDWSVRLADAYRFEVLAPLGLIFCTLCLALALRRMRLAGEKNAPVQNSPIPHSDSCLLSPDSSIPQSAIRNPQYNCAMWLFLSVPCAALAFWFFAAPAPRFAAGSFWVLAAGANAFLLERFVAAGRRRFAWSVLACLIGLSAFYSGKYWPVIKPGPEGGFHPMIRQPMTRFTTDSGLALYIPVQGDQCWDAPLPGTPYPRKNLKLRVAGELEKGFVLEE